ncbi:MAG: flagellar protein export ATPase FliI [Calditrichaeota bacterium]|nr:MAG: flagellar protein export ATPase FliI [Calditrichota bacterium]
MNPAARFDKYLSQVELVEPSRTLGKVNKVVGLVVESFGPEVSIGDLCYITTKTGKQVRAEVVGFRGKEVLLMPLEETFGIDAGCFVARSDDPYCIGVGRELLGRVLDGTGKPMDGAGPLQTRDLQLVHNMPPNPLQRERVRQPITTGVRVIDGLLTCGLGQRIGIFAGSGVGKSVLLGMIARNTNADVNVIGLIGERGREVRDFLERDLGEEGLRRSVVVAVTSEHASLIRVKGALVTTAIAEYFAGLGLNVMLMMDSLTRVAMAQREVGLAIGEPPTTKGYTPSVFAFLPRLLERAGNFQRGSITGIYTVLVESDDMNDPVADTVRSILDGHVVLSRKLASAGHYPAIDVLQSISRVMIDVVPREHMKHANKVKEILSVYQESEDLLNIGAYVAGSNPKIDHAVAMIDRIRAFQRQDISERTTLEDAQADLAELANAEQTAQYRE